MITQKCDSQLSSPFSDRWIRWIETSSAYINLSPCQWINANANPPKERDMAACFDRRTAAGRAGQQLVEYQPHHPRRRCNRSSSSKSKEVRAVQNQLVMWLTLPPPLQGPAEQRSRNLTIIIISIISQSSGWLVRCLGSTASQEAWTGALLHDK